ncbi:MAG: helix-turn-helix domain-containing protein [Anaerolineae bacterium]
MRDHTRLLTTGDVAQYCGASRMGVLRWIRQGKLKAHTTPGGHYRIQLADFRDFLERFDIPVDESFFAEFTNRVLVVTGDVATLGSIVEALSTMPEGYEIEVALDGASATDKLAHVNPALVILDSTAPEVDPVDLARQLETGPDGRSRPVLILTSSAMKRRGNGQRDDAITPDQDCFQQMPLDVEELQSTVRRLLAA